MDYVSPMLYPSSFQFGIPRYRRPVEHPYENRWSLSRTGAPSNGNAAGTLPPVASGVWDYAFGGRAFAATEVRGQIKAADDVGAGGWMLWNPRNEYSAAGLEP